MTTPGAQPQLSPDGQWWWNGTQWIPAAQRPLDPTAPAPAPIPANPFPNATYPQYSYQGAPQQATDPLAIVSLVASIVWMAGVGSIVAVITGHLSRSNAKKAGRQPAGIALAGIIIGYIGIAGMVLFIASFALLGATVHTAIREGASTNNAQVRTDLRLAATKEEESFTSAATYSNDLPAIGFKTYDYVTITVIRADEQSFCLEGQGAFSDVIYYDSATGGITDVPCS